MLDFRGVTTEKMMETLTSPPSESSTARCKGSKPKSSWQLLHVHGRGGELQDLWSTGKIMEKSESSQTHLFVGVMSSTLWDVSGSARYLMERGVPNVPNTLLAKSFSMFILTHLAPLSLQGMASLSSRTWPLVSCLPSQPHARYSSHKSRKRLGTWDVLYSFAVSSHPDPKGLIKNHKRSYNFNFGSAPSFWWFCPSIFYLGWWHPGTPKGVHLHIDLNVVVVPAVTQKMMQDWNISRLRHC